MRADSQKLERRAASIPAAVPSFFAYRALPVTLATPLHELAWIEQTRARQLARAGLETLQDLVTHYPRRYEDRRQFDRFPQNESETAVCVCGLVRSAVAKYWIAGTVNHPAANRAPTGDNVWSRPLE